MADTKLSALPAATVVAPADTVYIVQGGVSKRVPADLMGGGEVGTGNASPLSVVTPDFVGQRYVDTTADVAYIAVGTTSADWVELLTDTSGTALSAGVAATADTIIFYDADDNVPKLETLADIGTLLSAVTTNPQTGATYTLVLTDASKFITLGHATSNAVTIPPSVFPVGTVIALQLIGAGTGTIQGGTGVTLNGVSTGTGTLTARWSACSIIQTATNVWSVMGDIGTVA